MKSYFSNFSLFFQEVYRSRLKQLKAKPLKYLEPFGNIKDKI